MSHPLLYTRDRRVPAEYFKQNELNGNTITDTQAELIKTEIVKSRMLDNYTKTYKENKDKIGWVKQCTQRFLKIHLSNHQFLRA